MRKPIGKSERVDYSVNTIVEINAIGIACNIDVIVLNSEVFAGCTVLYGWENLLAKSRRVECSANKTVEIHATGTACNIDVIEKIICNNSMSKWNSSGRIFTFKKWHPSQFQMNLKIFDWATFQQLRRNFFNQSCVIFWKTYIKPIFMSYNIAFICKVEIIGILVASKNNLDISFKLRRNC